MTESAPNQSARVMGRDHGLTATEMNFLLKDEGLLDGGPGMWAVTEKGKQFADEQDHHRGTGGYAWHNRDWETRTWDPSITNELDLSHERKQHAQEAASAARKLKADLRAAQAAEFLKAKVEDGEPNNSGPNRLVLVVVVVGLAAGSVYAIKKLAPRLKARWADRAAKPKHRSAGDNDSDGDTELR